MDLDNLNMTELVELAQDHEPEAHRGLEREVLYKIILATEPVELPERQINTVRLRIMDYILEHWKQINPLLSCPARTENPRACFQCTDIQATECALENKKQIFGIGKEE